MEAKVVNLNSRFDSWRGDVEAMLPQLEAPRIARALAIPDAEKAIDERLNGLRWIFLVSDGTLWAQIRSNPHGEGRERDSRRKECPFRNRRGGRQGESSFYRQPRNAAGGGVVEALGIYTRDCRGFARKAPLKESFSRSREEHDDDMLESLETLLPDEAEGPAVFLCPELLFELPREFVHSLEAGEPHPAAGLNVSELFLRMTLTHEIGHHVLPAPERLRDGGYAYTSVSEALANTFCDALLDSTERQWLFAKARLLQPSAYLGYFVPHMLDRFEPRVKFLEKWRNVLRHILDVIPDGDDPRQFAGLHLFDRKPFVGSGQIYLAMWGLVEALSTLPEEALMRGFEPCALAPFDEFEMLWATEAGLLRLTRNQEPSVQAEAFHALTQMDARKPETDRELARWCDTNITSDDVQKATRAWNSSFAHREESRLDRYHEVALSKHEAIVADLPERVRRYCSTEEACSVIGGLLTDSRSAVRQAAVRELAALLLSDERAALSDHSYVAAVFGYAASHFDHDDLRKLTERGLRSLTNKDRMKVAEQLLLGKAKGPLALRLALVRTLRTSSIYDEVAIELLKEDHTDDPNYEVATEVLEEALDGAEGRRRFEVAATAVSRIRETDGPGYAVRERAAQAIVEWWTRSPGLSSEEQTASFQELLKKGYVVAILDVILPALLPGWSPEQIASVLKNMARHRNEHVRRAAASHLHQYGLMDVELQRSLLHDTKFLVMDQVWQDQGSGAILTDLLIAAAKGVLPSFKDREADAEKRAKIKNDALECLRRKLPSLSGEERASVEAVLPHAEIAPQKKREDFKRGCPSCGFSYGWNGSECRHCGRGKQ